jgi:hypothetical protein
MRLSEVVNIPAQEFKSGGNSPTRWLQYRSRRKSWRGSDRKPSKKFEVVVNQQVAVKRFGDLTVGSIFRERGRLSSLSLQSGHLSFGHLDVRSYFVKDGKLNQRAKFQMASHPDTLVAPKPRLGIFAPSELSIGLLDKGVHRSLNDLKVCEVGTSMDSTGWVLAKVRPANSVLGNFAFRSVSMNCVYGHEQFDYFSCVL